MPQLEQIMSPDTANSLGFLIVSINAFLRMPLIVYVKQQQPGNAQFCVTINHIVVALIAVPGNESAFFVPQNIRIQP